MPRFSAAHLYKPETAAAAAALDDMSQIPTETPDSAERQYFDCLSKGLFMLPHCLECGRHHFYPRVLCPHCGADSLEWVPASGKGVVYATTTVRSKASVHNVCLVDLEEGPRLMSRVVDIDSMAVQIGLPVRARVDEVDGKPLLVFVSAEGQA